MSDTLKNLIQTLLIPAVLAIIGFVINNTLQKQQRAFDKIKLTEQIINNAFETNNPNKAMALASMIPSIVDDKAFADSLVRMINRTYASKATEALATGNVEAYEDIATAAETFKGSSVTVSQSLERNPVVGKFEKARKYEKKGLEQIQNGSLEDAQESFEKAEKSYPGYKGANEISKLLKEKVQDIASGIDSAEVKKQIIEELKRRYDKKKLLKVVG
jgi:hypothetical protein